MSIVTILQDTVNPHPFYTPLISTIQGQGATLTLVKARFSSVVYSLHVYCKLQLTPTPSIRH